MAISKNLLYNFNQLRSDEKLRSVMKKEVSCQLQMWILEIHQEQRIFQRLLYGWVIPTNYNDGKWYKADVEMNWSPDDSNVYKVNIFKFTFYSNGDSIASLMAKLLEGNSLIEACSSLSLTKPPKELTEFTLYFHKIENTFAVRPPVFLETELINACYKNYVRSLQSPSHYVPSVSGSLFYLNKLHLWGEVGLPCKPIDSADFLAIFCISTLKKETGFSFDGSDSSRLGNIEWIAFPLSDPETSPVDFCTVKEEAPNLQNNVVIQGNGVKDVDVFLQSGVIMPDVNLLIRCRLRNHHEIVLDNVRLIEAKDAELGLRFSSNQQISRVQLTIWIKNKEENEWEIWYEADTPLMREINMEMGSIGLQGDVKLSTLKELKNSQKVKNRIQHYEKIKQMTYQDSRIMGYVHDPWIPPSVLGFAEWFQSLTNNNNKVITIVDPYFDTVGIELIAHSQTTNTSFEVITCTQVKSNNDNIKTNISETEQQKSKPEPERAIRIKNACDQLRLVLSRLQLNIWDLRSNQNGKGSYFHDRYFLIYDSSGIVSEGYHLSNSLQAATKFHPLLVTPIPIDILEEVDSYVGALRNAQSPIVNNASTILIYPKKEVDYDTLTNSIAGNCDKDIIRRISQATMFFAELLQDSELISIKCESIKRKLLDIGLLSSDNYFVVEDEELINQKLPAFSKRLIKIEDRLFPSLWESFSIWLANVIESQKYLFNVCDYAGINLAERIKSYILDSSGKNNEFIKQSQEIAVLQNSHFLNSEYKDSLYNARLFLDGHYDNRLYGNYQLHYATKAILYLQPSLIVNILETLSDQQGQQKGKNSVLGAYLLDELIIYLLIYSNHELINSLLLSNVPSLRALGSQAKWCHIKNITKSSTISVYNLIELDQTERIFAYAEWIYHLRVKSNRKGSESQDIKDVRIKIYEQIRVNWYDKLLECQKKAILRRLCGPSVGDWAKDIYHDLMLYLVQDNKITNDEAILFWINLMLQKIEGNKNKDISFYAPTDITLTELCASILPNLSEESWNSIVKQIRKQINNCNREIRRPFEKSNNFKNWNNIKKQGIWIKVFLELVYEASNDKKLDILGLLNSMDDKLKETTDGTETDNLLSTFANQSLETKFKKK